MSKALDQIEKRLAALETHRETSTVSETLLLIARLLVMLVKK